MHISTAPESEWTITLQDHPMIHSDLACSTWGQDEALSVTRALLTSLIDFHGDRLFHGAIMPSRIGLTRAGKLVVTDWASGFLAQLANQGPVTTVTPNFQALWGLPNYIPPELLNRHVLSPASDVFAIVCCLHRWLSGVDPFRANRTLDVYQRVRQGVRPSISDLAPRLDIELCRRLDAALAIEPADRPTTDELAHALEAFTTLPTLDVSHLETVRERSEGRRRDPREAAGPPDSEAERARQEAIRIATLQLDTRRETRAPRSAHRTRGMLAALLLLLAMALGLWLIT